MRLTRSNLLVLFTLLNACAVFEPRPTEAELAAEQARAEAAQRAAAEAELEAQRAEQERLLAEERARAAAAEEAARREQAARAETERQQQAEVERRREQSAPSVEARAQAVARQQERIAELRAQIAANQDETRNLESSNAALLEAITAAEELVETLTAEQDKYGNKDPATGATVEPLSKERIAQLNAELERLQAQAAALGQQQP